MGNYKDTHGRTFFGTAIGLVIPVVGVVQTVNAASAANQTKKTNEQAIVDSTLAANNAATQAQADTSAAAQADAAKSNTVKYVLIAGGVIVAIIGLVVGIKFLKNRKKKTA